MLLDESLFAEAVDVTSDRKRLDYLRRKEKVCPLDKAERYEITELEARLEEDLNDQMIDQINDKNANYEADKETTREVRKELAKQGIATNEEGEPLNEDTHLVDLAENYVEDVHKDFKQMLDSFEYNGAQYRGGSIPTPIHGYLNQANIPDNMRLKWFEIDDLSDGDNLHAQLTYVTQEPFDGDDAQDFIREAQVAFEGLAERFGFDKPFSITLDVRCRDGAEYGKLVYELIVDEDKETTRKVIKNNFKKPDYSKLVNIVDNYIDDIRKNIKKYDEDDISDLVVDLNLHIYRNLIDRYNVDELEADDIVWEIGRSFDKIRKGIENGKVNKTNIDEFISPVRKTLIKILKEYDIATNKEGEPLNEDTQLLNSYYIVDADEEIKGENLTRDEAKQLTLELKETAKDYIYVTRNATYETSHGRDNVFEDIVNVDKNGSNWIVHTDKFNIFKNITEDIEIPDGVEDAGTSQFGDRQFKYKGFTIAHFPYDMKYDDKTDHFESYIIESPATLSNGYHLPLYCEDENGEVVNFLSLEAAKMWIDNFKDRFKLEVKHGNEIHAVIKPEVVKESFELDHSEYDKIRNSKVNPGQDLHKIYHVNTLEDA